MDREAWQATVHGVRKGPTPLSTHTHMKVIETVYVFSGPFTSTLEMTTTIKPAFLVP